MTTVPAHQIAADLLSAANHIETYGHVKRHYGFAGHPCCAVGALQVAVFGCTLEEDEAIAVADRGRYEMARATLIKHVPQVGGPLGVLPNWNDAPPTTAADVVGKFREAAEAVFPADPPGRAPGGSTETGLAYMEASKRFDGHGAARTEGEPS